MITPTDIDLEVGDCAVLVYFLGVNVHPLKIQSIVPMADHLPLGGLSWWKNCDQDVIRLWFLSECARNDLAGLSDLTSVFPSQSGDVKLLSTANNVNVGVEHFGDRERVSKRSKIGQFCAIVSQTKS